MLDRSDIRFLPLLLMYGTPFLPCCTVELAAVLYSFVIGARTLRERDTPFLVRRDLVDAAGLGRPPVAEAGEKGHSSSLRRS